MKKILLFLNGLLLCTPMIAQQIFDGNNSGPVKLSDVVEMYKQNQQNLSVQNQESDDPDEIVEGKDYHFDRWMWYWKQHLDQDGYMVSPMKNWEEWEKYKQANSLNNIAAKTTSNNSQWVFEGPDSSGANGKGVGRINVVAFHPTDVNTYWAGSPGGGAWKTTNNGVSWTCMTDQNPLLGVSDIVINPLNPNTIYLCTGDRDGGDYYSVGVLKSTNGGQTWATTGITWTTNNLKQSNSLVINPLDTNTLILAASDGIHRSYNGGTTWTIVKGGNFKQVLYHPTDTTILYATTYLQPGNTGSAQIYRSGDGGTTWTQVSALSGATRIELAVSPANVAIVKAAAAKLTDLSLLGVYTSTDTGHTFTTTFSPCSSGTPNILGSNTSGSDCTYGQGWYDLCIALSPTNANNVYVGGINSWYSTNGGTSWSILNHGYGSGTKVHPDKHCLKFSTVNTNRLFEGNDGGIYWADNPGGSSTWNNATNGLGITEFYRLAVSNIATYQVAGGQDVGCKYVQAKKYVDVNGGDGMGCQMDFKDSTIYYVASQYGAINRNTLGGGQTNITVGGQTGAWVTPYIIEPMCHNCLLAGYQKVYKSTNSGNSWTAISGTLTSGGVNLLRVAVAPSDSNTIYAMDDGDRYLYYTHTGGGSAPWPSINVIYGGTMSDIAIDPKNKNHFWITYSGYNTDGVIEFDSSNTTTVPPYWKIMKYNLPNVPVNCIKIDTSNMNIYIGTDVGVFYKDTTMTTWQLYNAGLPVVRVNDLQINYGTNEIWAATYGRSLWKSPKQASVAGVSVVPSAPNSLTIVPNPNHGNFTINIKGNVSSNTTAAVHLFDLTGRSIWSNRSNINDGKIQINTSGVASGIYIMEVTTPDAVLGRTKIIIY